MNTHPEHLIGAAETRLLLLWQQCRGGGAPPVDVLPSAGGMFAQPAFEMAAFKILDNAAAAIRRDNQGAFDHG